MTSSALPKSQIDPQQELKPCPCCSGEAVLNPEDRCNLVYAECRGCGLRTLPGRVSVVVTSWNSRKNATAVAGGKATRGLRSKKKLWSSRRNLRKARRVKTLKRLRPFIQQAVAELDRLREVEAQMLDISDSSSAHPLNLCPDLAATKTVHPVPGPDLPAEQIHEPMTLTTP